MSPKPSRVPETRLNEDVYAEINGEVVLVREATSNRIPLCSKHKIKTVRNVDGAWVCEQCADEWLRDTVRWANQGRSVGGVELPMGVEDPRQVKASFRDVWPNHDARRRARHG
jgi:hypothetical protein